MRCSIVWTGDAEEDLRRIYSGIRENSVRSAERVYAALIRSSQMLSSNPRIGMAQPRLGVGARTLVSGNYVILYELIDEEDED